MARVVVFPPDPPVARRAFAARQLRQAFHAADTDGNGVLSMRELAGALKAVLQRRPSKAEVKAVMKVKGVKKDQMTFEGFTQVINALQSLQERRRRQMKEGQLHHE